MASRPPNDFPNDAAKSRPRRSRRLWPLLFLPILGGLIGAFVVPYFSDRGWTAGDLNSGELAVHAAFGVLGGTELMIGAAVLVAVYRVAHQRFTIRTILIAIAAIAVLLTLARAILF